MTLDATRKASGSLKSPSAPVLDAADAPQSERTAGSGTRLGVLVGYDGSRCSERALRWAARQARASGTGLTVCQAWRAGFPVPRDEEDALEVARQGGERVAAAGLRLARDLMGSKDVQSILAGGTAAAVLCEHCREADMVVTGARGRGGMAGLLLGSVSEHVAAYADGPVVVVRGHWSPAAEFGRGAIVVGVDGSPGCQAAVDFAFQQAALWEVPLLAVCALADAPGTLGDARVCRKDFELTIAGALENRPQVEVQRLIAPGGARTAILSACRGAQLVVVGPRGRGGIQGMALGSVSQAVLHHAPCPVAVVHPG
jgi:nucleotide-binding universal stress UspA family protein